MILAFYMIPQGFRASYKTSGDYRLKSGELKMIPRTFKLIILTIIGFWAVVQALLLMTRQSPFGASVAYGLIFATIAMIASLERLIEKLLPDGAKRHRVLGRITMLIYALILVTSTATYLMLYFIYPVKH